MERFFKKEIIIKILLIVIVILLTKIAMSPININYPTTDWMKNIDDNKPINDLVIPGTHDSGSTHSIFDVAGKCQDMSIKNQLNVGIRFLDIRLQLVKDELSVVHSFVDQNLSFIDVLEDINEFINNYQTEFLIISIKEDSDPKNSTVEFEDKVLEELSKYNRIVLDSLPKTIKDARGKIYILNRFTSIDVGINAYNGWRDSTSFELGDLYIQDNYSVHSTAIKIDDIKKTFELSMKDPNHLYLNFTSCYLNNTFPPLYAGTPAKKINKWLIDYLNEYQIKGIVIMDFVTKDLVKTIYEVNYEKTN